MKSHLFSYYHSGLEEDENETELARFIYSPNCKSCDSKDYTVIGDYGYDYDAARKAVNEANKKLFFQSIVLGWPPTSQILNSQKNSFLNSFLNSSFFF